MAGISNQTIVKFIEENTNEDLKQNFIGVFPTNYTNKFNKFHDILIESGASYPFVIMNTDRADKKDTHWWSFLDLHPKKEIFFLNSFGFTGFKEFILNDNEKIMNRVFYDLKKSNVPDNKLRLVTIKIKRSYNLSETAIDVMRLINSFGRRHSIKDEVKIHMVDDTLQMTEKDTCGLFQLYFYVNLFNPLENSTIIYAEKLNKKATEVLLNEKLTTDKEENENRVETSTHENNVTRK